MAMNWDPGPAYLSPCIFITRGGSSGRGESGAVSTQPASSTGPGLGERHPGRAGLVAPAYPPLPPVTEAQAGEGRIMGHQGSGTCVQIWAPPLANSGSSASSHGKGG